MPSVAVVATPASPGRARPETRAAFTLIEILVVLAIIALIAALLLPAFAKAKGKARNAKWLSDVRQTNIVLFIQAMDNENDNFFPFDGRSNGPTVKTNPPVFK